MSERGSHIAAWSGPLERLSDPLAVPVVDRGGKPFDVTVRPPGSKSITNRALLLAALAEGESTLRGALVEADDARVMIAALRELGAGIEVDGTTVRVSGVNGRWKIAPGRTVTLDLHNAGTATRFLTAAALLAPAGTSVVIDGDARMRERPIGELVRHLNALTNPHRCAEYVGIPGFPPVRIRTGLVSETLQVFGRTQSSQFVSAILLLAPFLPRGLRFRWSTSDVTSRSYIDMTLGLLSRVGVQVSTHDGEQAVLPVHPCLRAFDFDIEPDASGATYFEAAAALVPGARVTVEGLDLHPSRASLQGDTQFVRVLTEMGAKVERLNGALRVTGPERLRGVDVDLSDMPDTAMTAAVLACFAEGPSTLRGLRTLRVKETDRLEALRVELTKIGAGVEVFAEGGDEGLRITPVGVRSGDPSGPHYSAQSSGVVARGGRIEFDTYKDHRMAMALALVGLRRPGVWIRDPGCVAKTYPTFWRDLAKIYA